MFISCSTVKKAVSMSKTLEQKIETRDYTIGVERCYPTDLVNSSFGSDVCVKVKNDSAFSDLPFHGLLDVNPQKVTAGNISVEDPIKEYVMKQNNKNGWDIAFLVNAKQYHYQFTIEISSKGKAVIKVTSTERTTMTYYGEVY